MKPAKQATLPSLKHDRREDPPAKAEQGFLPGRALAFAPRYAEQSFCFKSRQLFIPRWLHHLCKEESLAGASFGGFRDEKRQKLSPLRGDASFEGGATFPPDCNTPAAQECCQTVGLTLSEAVALPPGAWFCLEKRASPPQKSTIGGFCASPSPFLRGQPLKFQSCVETSKPWGGFHTFEETLGKEIRGERGFFPPGRALPVVKRTGAVGTCWHPSFEGILLRRKGVDPTKVSDTVQPPKATLPMRSEVFFEHLGAFRAKHGHEGCSKSSREDPPVPSPPRMPTGADRTCSFWSGRLDRLSEGYPGLKRYLCSRPDSPLAQSHTIT
ncbi:hypothetical protein RRG08_003303 [Elysia crispata]|uniref:Uncharacterized protein n=1 Tax=Elysia crispata TaxID=231223 RepID=A0AAE0ZSU9_9GAST|nr:hypothetical protein RRG08_003303 [Elysia crispata]